MDTPASQSVHVVLATDDVCGRIVVPLARFLELACGIDDDLRDLTRKWQHMVTPNSLRTPRRS